MRISVLCALMLFVFVALFSVYVDNEPFDLEQPDGSILKVFMTGDEFYRRVYDVDGYTLLQHPRTGFAVYAIPDGNSIKPSEYRAGSIDPATLGISPGLRLYDPNLPERFAEAQRMRVEERNNPVGQINSLVIFVRFSDQPEFPTGMNFQAYDNFFNSMTTQSLKDYYDEVSNGQLSIDSYLYPPPNQSGHVVSVQSPHIRNYYLPYVETVNDSGYVNDEEGGQRLRALMGMAIAVLEELVPPDLNIDQDNNGYVDGVTMIIRGSADAWGHILWPTSYTTGNPYGSINNKLVNRLIVNLQNVLSVRVVCHEMGHQIGAPDFYHYSNSSMGHEPWIDISPTYEWEMMSNNRGHWLTHTKCKYGTWFNNIPEIIVSATPTTYTLTAIDTDPYSCYKIPSSSPQQFYMVEYRRQAGRYEADIPGTGLIVYRVINGIWGNAGGPPDEIYVYRPGGTLTQNGNPSNAYFSSQSGRTSLTNEGNPSPWLWADTLSVNLGNISITNVGLAGGNTITFQVSAAGGSYVNWSGAISSDWHNPGNWVGNQIPDQNSVVIIPEAVSHFPVISSGPAMCRKLSLFPGSELNINSNSLFIYEDLLVYGTLRMTHQQSVLAVAGKINWLTGAEVEITHNDAIITVESDMIFEETTSISMQMGTVIFGGNNNSILMNFSNLTRFKNLIVNKSNGAELIISAESANLLFIDGYLRLTQNNRIVNNCAGTIGLKGDLISENTNSSGIAWQNGLLLLQGTNQYISLPHSSDQLYKLSLGNTGFLYYNYPMTITNNLIIGSGSTLSIDAQSFTVNGFATIYGTINMNHHLGDLFLNNDVVWESTASLNITNPSAEIYCKGSMTFENGSNVQMGMGYLEFFGDAWSFIINKSTSTQIHNLRSNKNAPAALAISSSSTQNLTITGSIWNYQNRVFWNFFGGEVILMGNLTSNNTNTEGILWSAGTLTLNGTNHLISIANPAGHINNLKCNHTATFSLGSNFWIKGNAILNTGTFSPSSYIVKVAGNWTKNSNATFNNQNSTVIFNGTSDQLVQNTIFNILRLDKSSGKLVIPNNSTVTAQSFKYDTGTLEVNGGVFIAYDLADNNVKGNYILNSGMIELYQDSTYFVDLDSNITISNGTMNIFGGYNFPVDWAYTRAITINMSGGVLDFGSNSIGLTETGHNINLQLSGGVIRTAGSFIVNRANFNPGGGTIELIGSNDALISHSANSSFWDLRINKIPSRETISRERYNKVTLNQNTTIAHDVIVQNGTLAINPVTVNINNDLIVNSTLQMNNTGTVINVNRDVTLGPFSTTEMSQGYLNVNRNFNATNGASLIASTNNTVCFYGNQISTINIAEPGLTFGNVDINKAVNWVQMGTAPSYLNVNGVLAIYPSSQLRYLSGTATVNSTLDIGGSVTMHEGSSVTIQNLTLNGTLGVAGGIMTVNNNFSQGVSGVLNVAGGDFIIDTPYTGALFAFGGAVNLTSGAFQITNNGILFGASSALNQTGGSLKIGSGWRAMVENSLHLDSGTVEFIGARSATIEMAASNYFHNLLINKPSTAYAVYGATNVVVNNDLLVQNGLLSPLVPNSLIVNRDVVITGGSLAVNGNNQLLRVGRNWVNEVGTNGFLEGNGIVEFISSLPATMTSETFKHLRVSKTTTGEQNLIIPANATVTVNGNLEILTGCLKLMGGSVLDGNGNVLIETEGGLNLSSQDSQTLFKLAGHYTDASNLTGENYGLNTGGNSRILFDGTGDQAFSTDAERFTLANIEINKSGGEVGFFGSLDVMGDFVVLNGSVLLDNFGAIFNLYKNFTFIGSGSLNLSNDQLNFVGSEPSLVNIANPVHIPSLNIQKTAQGYISLLSDLELTGTTSMWILSGEFRVEDNLFSVGGSVNIINTGRLVLTAGSVLDLADLSTIITDGIGSQFVALGTADDPAKITSSDGYYTFTVRSSGLMKAQHCIFEKMGVNGINFTMEGTMDPQYSMAYCTFRDGAPGGRLVRIASTLNFTIPNAHFPENTWGSAYNAQKINYAGIITFLNADGPFAGPDYEYDQYGRINWEYTTVPETPQNLVITLQGGIPILVWDASPGATLYLIYRTAENLDGDWGDPIATTGNTNWSDSDPLPGGRAFYRITAANSRNELAISRD